MYVRQETQWTIFTFPELGRSWGMSMEMRIINFFKFSHEVATCAHPYLSDRYLWLSRPDEPGAQGNSSNSARPGYLTLKDIKNDLLNVSWSLHSDQVVSEALVRKYLRLRIYQKGFSDCVEDIHDYFEGPTDRD
jgi:hypothetical protein